MLGEWATNLKTLFSQWKTKVHISLAFLLICIVQFNHKCSVHLYSNIYLYLDFVYIKWNKIL